VSIERRIAPHHSGPPGRLQLVEHRLDPLERRLQIDDPPLLDFLDATLDGGAELVAASLGFAAGSDGGAVVVGAAWWGRSSIPPPLSSPKLYAKSSS
jgi:hypothetical protein